MTTPEDIRRAAEAVERQRGEQSAIEAMAALPLREIVGDVGAAFIPPESLHEAMESAMGPAMEAAQGLADVYAGMAQRAAEPVAWVNPLAALSEEERQRLLHPPRPELAALPLPYQERPVEPPSDPERVAARMVRQMAGAPPRDLAAALRRIADALDDLAVTMEGTPDDDDAP